MSPSTYNPSIMEKTVAEKLNTLQKLQEIDSKLDEIRKVRGDLPEEIQDLEDEVEGYKTRVARFESEYQQLDQAISNKYQAIKNSEQLILKYDEQQMNVRNNREYDAIAKEKELQELEIQISRKKIKEAEVLKDQKREQIEQTKEIMTDRQKDLTSKQEELEVIMKETATEEEKLNKEHEKAGKNLDPRLLRSYVRIRDNARNGLAVVSVKRGACGGCFNMVPPQRRADIKERKKLIVCEHCGRILADVEYYEEPTPKKKKATTRKKTTRKKTATK